MTRPETPSTATTTPSRNSTCTSSPASSWAHRQRWAARHPQTGTPDAYLSETLHAAHEADCPRCGGAFPLLSHDFTGESMGRECLTCEYAEDL
ncbi:hypothetical protein Ddep01_00663 [Deinococcus depolymerans]